MSREVPIKNLEDIHYAALEGNQKPDLCHVYGLFRKEETRSSTLVWHLFDEYKEVAIYLCGKIEEYPRPKPGDVVRIHRLRIDSTRKRPEISLGRNVVYWPAFQFDPKPVSTAKNPTLTEEDNRRRRVLETLYSSNITRCSDILRGPNNEGFLWLQAVAGRVETNQPDMFEHREIRFIDGTEPPVKPGQILACPMLRVFKPLKADEYDMHFKVAEKLQKGQYFVATNVKLARNYNLHLSSNDLHGRSLRIVEEASILGVKLKESLGDTRSDQQAGCANGQHTQLRRSPRLNNQNTEENPASNPASQSVNSTTTAQIEIVNNQDDEDLFPKLHRFSEIKPKESGYDFYNLFGQVREKPRLTKQYGNCVLQIFDGSRHNHANYYDNEVEQIVDGCLILYVYSKQEDRDTNEHFEKALNLKPGDIIYIRNVKVSSRGGRLRLELQANKLHNKSINLIDVDSPFGRKILDIVQTPQVEEILTDEASDSSQEPRF